MAASSSLPRLLVLLLLVAVTLVVADPATASARNERRNVTAALPASTNDAQWTVTITDPFPSVAAYIPLAADDVSISPAYTIINADTHYNAFCWYPISGNYGRFPRILYYCTIVFALMARTHQWLMAGALAAALTYSGAAAIHACLLVWHGPGTGELDIAPLLAILSTACIITVPLLNWSSTVRRLGLKDGDDDGKSGARTIIVYWGFLVTVGFMCCMVAYWDPKVTAFTLYNYSGLPDVSCSPANAELNLTVGQNVEWGGFVITAEFVYANNCINPCSVTYNPGSIFREDKDLALLNFNQVNRYIAGLETAKDSRNDRFIREYFQWGLAAITYVLLQGIWAVCFGRRDPAQVRNLLYLIGRDIRLPFRRRLSALPTQSSDLAPRPIQRKQTWLAKAFAMSAYLWAILILVVCPPMFVVNLVAVELFINPLPQSENHTHIGAWSPWAATALVLVAALIARFHSTVVETAIKFINNEIFYRTGRYWRHARNWGARYRGHQLPYPDSAPDPTRPGLKDRKKSHAPDPEFLKETTDSAFGEIGKVFGRGWSRGIEAIQVPLDEWQDFRAFCHNADVAERHDGRAVYKDEGIDALIRSVHSEKFTWDISGRIVSVPGKNLSLNLHPGYMGNIDSITATPQPPHASADSISSLGPTPSVRQTRERLDPTLLPGGQRVAAFVDRLGITQHILPDRAANQTSSSASVVQNLNPARHSTPHSQAVSRPTTAADPRRRASMAPLPPLPLKRKPTPAPGVAGNPLPSQDEACDESLESDQLLAVNSSDDDANPAGLTQSLEGGIMSRHRRSQAYSPALSPHAHQAATSDCLPTANPHPHPNLNPNLNPHPQSPNPRETQHSATSGPLEFPPEWDYEDDDAANEADSQQQHTPSSILSELPAEEVVRDSGGGSDGGAFAHGQRIQIPTRSPSVKAPRPGDGADAQGGGRARCMVNYLQVRRPETRVFGEEICLRRGADGVYVVVGG